MDWQLFHLLNGLLLGHGLVGDEVEDFTLWSVPALAAATIGLWLVARPGTTSRWRVACAGALASAGLALMANQVISHLWARARPTDAHAAAHLYLVAPSHDPSLPRHHAAASFAVALACLLVTRSVASRLFCASDADAPLTRLDLR